MVHKTTKMFRALRSRRCSLQYFHRLRHQSLPTTSTTARSLKTPLNSLSLINPIRQFTTSSPSSSDAEFQKYVGYTALLLFYGGATYHFFPFLETAEHKKAQIFRYAPLPKDLHAVSNWSGTHEVETRNFHQPENLEHKKGGAMKVVMSAPSADAPMLWFALMRQHRSQIWTLFQMQAILRIVLLLFQRWFMMNLASLEV